LWLQTQNSSRLTIPGLQQVHIGMKLGCKNLNTVASSSDEQNTPHCKAETTTEGLLSSQLRKPGAQITLRIYCSLLLLCYWLVLRSAR